MTIKDKVLHIRLTETELAALDKLVASLSDPAPERANVVRRAISDFIAFHKKNDKRTKKT